MTRNIPTQATPTASWDRSKNVSKNIIQDFVAKFKSDEDWLEWFKRGRGHR